jgi:hypothetical protein
MKVVRDRLGRSAVRVVGFLGLLAGVSGVAMAGFGPTPEIDPGSMVNALLVLSGSVLIVTGRRPRK